MALDPTDEQHLIIACRGEPTETQLERWYQRGLQQEAAI